MRTKTKPDTIAQSKKRIRDMGWDEYHYTSVVNNTRQDQLNIFFWPLKRGLWREAPKWEKRPILFEKNLAFKRRIMHDLADWIGDHCKTKRDYTADATRTLIGFYIFGDEDKPLEDELKRRGVNITSIVKDMRAIVNKYSAKVEK